MRVLMLHNDYAQVGGEYFSVRAEVSFLRSLGHEVELVTIDNTAVMAQGGSKRVLFETLVGSESTRLVADAIHNTKPDIIHVQNLFPMLGSAAITEIARAKLPWVRSLRNYRMRCLAGTCFRNGSECTSCHSSGRAYQGVYHGCYRGSRAASMAALAYGVKESRASAAYSPSAYILLSEAMHPLMSDLIADTPYFVKPNAVLGSVDYKPVPRALRKEEFLYVGRLTAEKGAFDLIDQFLLTPHLNLRLIGDGELSSTQRELVATAPNITLEGVKTSAYVEDAMKQALAVLVPSLWAEPFGRVAAESLAAGTPPLTSPRGGLVDIVKGITQHNLTVTDEHNWASAAQVLKQTEPGQYDKLTAACHRRWRECFSAEPVGSKLIRIYDAVLARH